MSRLRSLPVAVALGLPIFFAMNQACGPSKPAASPSNSTSASESASTAKNGGDNGEEPPPPPPPSQEGKGIDSNSAKSSYNDGIAAYNSGKLDVAIKSFQATISAEPKAYEAYFALGVCYERQGRNADALESYRNAFKLNSNYEQAMAAYAFLLYRQGSRTDAISFLSEQNAKTPRNKSIMTALGELKSLDGDSGSAQSLAGDVLTFDAKFEPAMVLIARDYLRHGKTSLATLVLDSLLDGDKARAPNNAEAFFLRGILLLRSGARQTAIEAFRHSTELRPDLVDAQAQLGYLRLESNDADGAIDPLEKAIAYGGGHPETHLALAEAYRIAGGRATLAKKEYEYVLASVGASAQLKAVANYDLGLLYFFTPNIDDLKDAPRFRKSQDYFDKYKTLKGTSAGVGWPDDADAMSSEAHNAADLASPATGAAGTPSAKLPSLPSSQPLPPPSTSAKPATSTTSPASTSAKPATSSSALPAPSASPSTKPSGAPR